MAKDVQHEICNILQPYLNDKIAEEFWKNLITEKRVILDVWG